MASGAEAAAVLGGGDAHLALEVVAQQRAGAETGFGGDALERVLRDPPFGARLAAAARRAAAEKYSRERMNRRYEELFLSLARGA